MRKLHIKRFSTGSIILAGILSVLFIIVCVYGSRYYQKMDEATQQYVDSEQAALQLQKGSDILTDQVRMYVLTGEKKYMDGYFTEANITKSREKAVEALHMDFDGTQSLKDLEAALSDSQTLMEREYYAMRLSSRAYGLSDEQLPQEVRSIELSMEDLKAIPQEQLEKARSMVSDSIYQGMKGKITDSVDQCVEDLLQLTQNRKNTYSRLFRHLYFLEEIGFVLLIILLIVSSLIVRTLVVNPLVRYNASIKQDETVPVIGAAELQSLAQTYNKVFTENQATQRIIRHEAEHDALSGLLNRGSFNKILSMYTESNLSFALIIVDIDVFKSVNDTYGHTIGDAVIAQVAEKIKSAFRVTDYVFRIGGDEFAVIMLDMTSRLRPAIEEKLLELKESLKHLPESIPTVTISAGIAFSDRENPTGTIFQDADKVLYRVKENGKDGYLFYGE